LIRGSPLWYNLGTEIYPHKVISAINGCPEGAGAPVSIGPWNKCEF